MKHTLNNTILAICTLMLFSILSLAAPRPVSAQAVVRPDLTITNVTVSKSAGKWFAHALVRNVGNAASPACKMSLTLTPFKPAQNLAAIPMLPPGNFAWVKFSLGAVYPAGCTGLFCADSTSIVLEWSEINNDFTYLF